MTPDDFDRALRRWASAPPKTRPQEAAHQVTARATRTASRPFWWLAPVAAAALLAVFVVFRGGRVAETPPTPAPAEDTAVVPLLPDNVVLWWIDPETPVYFVVAPPTTSGGPS